MMHLGPKESTRFNSSLGAEWMWGKPSVTMRMESVGAEAQTL